MEKIDLMLRKCKSLSKHIGRSSSYSSLRSTKSTKNLIHTHHQEQGQEQEQEQEHEETLFVGSTRKRYVVSSKHLTHPLLKALIDKPPPSDRNRDDGEMIYVKCEVVLFDHILWMLENGDPNLASGSMEELAQLYVS